AQRRNQKVIEETPAPGLTDEQRAGFFEAAIKLGQAVNYRSAGTVEFVFDAETGEFYFLEVNTRLQVEHGVTEEVIGIDLVEWMVLQASGDLHAPVVNDRSEPASSVNGPEESSGMKPEAKWPAAVEEGSGSGSAS